jgi:hypothetical protein
MHTWTLNLRNMRNTAKQICTGTNKSAKRRNILPFKFLMQYTYFKMSLYATNSMHLCKDPGNGYCRSLSLAMKNTSNLSFLICICSVVMPAIWLKSAATKLSIQRNEDINFVAQQELHRATKANVTESYTTIHQQHRNLQMEEDPEPEFDCETALEILLGFNSDLNLGCTCGEDGKLTYECELLQSECSLCDIIQNEQACFVFAEAESTARSSRFVEAKCYTYETGPFAGTTNCAIDNFADASCTILIDGERCNSCKVIACSATDGERVYSENYDIDCSNIIEGETWNLCTDDLPETSRFLASGNNDRFSYVYCGTPNVRQEDILLEKENTDGNTVAPSASPVSTNTPTGAPTTTPTIAPIAKPSTSPSTAPIASPTATPSIAPTTAPSVTRSLRPSPVPSAAPIAARSAAVSSSTSTGVSHSDTRPERKYVKTRGGSSTIVTNSRDEDPPSEAIFPEVRPNQQPIMNNVVPDVRPIQQSIVSNDQSIVSNEATTIVRKDRGDQDSPSEAIVPGVPQNQQSIVSTESSTVVRKIRNFFGKG